MATKTINNFGVITSMANSDKLPLWQVSSAATKAITYANFVTAIIGSLAGTYIKADGSVALTGNWDIGSGLRILADGIRARSSSGLRLEEDGGALGLFVQDATGRVGIGTASPVQLLHIGGGGQSLVHSSYEGIYINPNLTNVQCTVENNAGVEGGFFAHNTGIIYFGSWSNHKIILRTNVTDALTIDTSQNVGIGTTSPNAKFDVNGAGRIGYDADTTSYIGRTALGFCTGWSDAAYFGHIDKVGINDYGVLQNSTGSLYLNASSTQEIRFNIANSEKMTLTSGAKFGIGTTVPDTKLHVMEASAGTVTAATNSVVTIENSTDAVLQMLVPNGANSYIFFWPSESEQRWPNQIRSYQSGHDPVPKQHSAR
jgi:hypothetical protein